MTQHRILLGRMSCTLDASPRWLEQSLARMGLATEGEHPACLALPGGVSSDIYRVDLASGPVCVKRALPRLKVKALWQAPVERNRYEVAWIRRVGAIVPAFAPRIVGEDAESGAFAMEWLAPERYANWKEQLRDGAIEPEVAAEVARRIARVHGATAGDEAVARDFPTDAIFDSIRLEPYLRATAGRAPECADALLALSATTASNKRALVHGDVSPKNILVGPAGPLLLDAECAWYGDPAFDLAFCLNHMLLKCLWRPHWTDRYFECFDALASTYVGMVTWESPARMEARTARLLPGLFLGRVDGKSPAEYVTEERDKARVRRVARALLLEPVESLAAVRSAWREELRA